MKQLDSLVRGCVQKGYVTEEQAPWLRYALEKRLVTFGVFIPLLGLGGVITNPATMLAFLITFCLLRTRTNGFHAKSSGRCLIYSMVGELFFLRVLPTLWNDAIAFVTLAISAVLIWILAPYNHPSMNLSAEEILACAKSAKWRLGLLGFVLSVLSVWKQEQLAEGIILGIVMTASTLVMAYCSRKTMFEKCREAK